MIRIAVAEDDLSWAHQLQTYVDQYARESGKSFEVSLFADGEDLLEQYHGQFDLVFLDVQMRFLDGMATAELIRRADPEVIIIFITNMAQYAIRGYEVDAIKNILQNQYVQYRQSRESIDVINRKYHDLKHQIAVLRAEQDPARRSAFLDQMEEEIQHYEAQNKTGNSVLDTVLTGKSLYCAKHQIKLTCVADGARLAFMDVMDICTLFGNAPDNAIECELSIPDKEKRLIHLEVYAKKDFLVIRCENYCPTPPVFGHGLPVTTKADREYHGYGLKSMRYTAQKYGGTMTVQAKDEWFQLTLLFPLDHH